MQFADVNGLEKDEGIEALVKSKELNYGVLKQMERLAVI
jgi:hypothetical protein